MSASDLTLTPYHRRDRSRLLQWMGASFYRHNHLDWEPLPKWLSDPANFFALAWCHHQLCGAAAFSPAHNRTSWLRLLLLPQDYAGQIFKALWAYLLPFMQTQVDQIAVMPHDEWLIPHLQAQGFDLFERVINLKRHTQPLPDTPPATIQIRRLRWGEFGQVLRVDHTAFTPLWQMRLTELREAGRHAYHYTLAHDGEKVVGYQMSMLYGKTMHLSRLAVLPSHQNQHLGGALLQEMLLKAEKIGATDVTVNTQWSNTQSRRLYERYGFDYDGTDMPVYCRYLKH